MIQLRQTHQERILKPTWTGGLLVLSVFLLLAGRSYAAPEFATFPKFDAHVHVRTLDPTFVEGAVQDGFQLLTICTRSSEQELIDRQAKFYMHLAEKFPGTVFWATTFSMDGFGTPEWQANVIRRLGEDFDRGAIAVKVWKDIGMTFRDKDGKFIMIDDPRFDPVLDFISSRDKTVVAHIGEPKNCWMPLDKMDVKSNRAYYEGHPEYHMYLHPEYPSHEQLMAARDHMLEKHPKLRVVGCHLGSLEWDVDELAKRLDRYPNFAVDMSARVAHLQIQDRKKVLDFIAKYPDRLLYGTDTTAEGDANMEAARKRIHEAWLADWDYFTTDKELTSPKIDPTFRGLNLDEKTLKKIYFENAKKWYPGAAKQGN